MDRAPGSIIRDSRALSVEAAQYDAEAVNAEAEIHQLEAKMKAARAKANQARLQKQQSEAAREDAFQQEREERQAAVRVSITDHHIEGMRKAVKLDHTQHLINDLKKVAAGDVETAPNAAVFVGAMVLRELVGYDGCFLTEIAEKVLAGPVVITSQRYDALSGHQISPKLAPNSPSPTAKSSRLFLRSPQVSVISPSAPSHGRDQSPGLGIEGIGAASSLQGNQDIKPEENGLLTVEVGVETLETLVESEGQEEAEVTVIDIDEETSNQKVFLAEGALKAVELDSENDNSTSDFDNDSNPAKWNLDTMVGVEYGAEPDKIFASNDHLAAFKQEPLAASDSSNAINAIASLAKLKRQSTETANSDDSDSVSSPLSVFRRAAQVVQGEQSTISRPQTPQLAGPNLRKKLAGLDVQHKTSPASKKPSGKRKRQESEGSISVSVESGEVMTTPAKKGKMKAKDENAVIPKRVADFVKQVKTLSSANQSEAILCSICGAPPKGPRLSHCLHLYCEICWKATADQAKQSGKTKLTEQPCMREGCEGTLGKAVMVPAYLGISDMRSDIWTSQKVKGGAASAEDQKEEAMDVDVEENSIEVDLD